MTDRTNDKKGAKRTGVSRRTALGLIGAGIAGAAGAGRTGAALAAPAVGKKVTITFWNWADNPNHQKMSVDGVKAFNASQNTIEVQLDASSLVQDLRTKVVAAYASGSAPDVAGTVQTWVQDYYDNGILAPVDEYFNKWDAHTDYFPNIVAAMRSKPDQPVLYMPNANLPYILYYRADWFDAAGVKPPETYDEFIAAAKAMTKDDHYGYALRGLDYYAVQPIEPIWHSAGVEFVKDGKVDFNSQAAVDVTAKWVGMYTTDHSCQPTAVNDRYSQLFALMEKNKAAMWIYGTHANPQLSAALGDKIQCVPTPRVGEKNYMLANPEGSFILSTSKEKEAAFEFLKFWGSGETNKQFTQGRGLLPVRQSLAADPFFEQNRFFKVAIENADKWWMPPFSWKYWTNYQDKIAPYWQQALQQSITVQQFQDQAAAFLRGEG
jgi:multiple sugar transport system substrate-binding protein